MDSISSISFPNEPLVSWTQRWTFLDHFCHHFWVGLVLLCCCSQPKVMIKMVKKCSKLCSTDQRFIRKQNTTFRIHTLVRLVNPFSIKTKGGKGGAYYALQIGLFRRPCNAIWYVQKFTDNVPKCCMYWKYACNFPFEFITSTKRLT